MNILITGISSAIGMHLAKRLVDHGHGVVGFDIKEPDDLPQDVVFIKGDVRNSESLTAAAKDCDSGIHLAAISCDSLPEDMMSINIYGAYCFLCAGKRAQFKNAIVASSAPVHLAPSDLDDHCLLRTSEGEDYVYDLTKTVQEVVGRDFHSHGLPVLCLRFGHIVRGKEELNLKRTQPLKDVDYCRGGWVALEDIVVACAAALQITPNTEKLEVLHLVGARGARSRFHIDDAESRLGIKFQYDFAAFE